MFSFFADRKKVTNMRIGLQVLAFFYLFEIMRIDRSQALPALPGNEGRIQRLKEATLFLIV